MQWNPLDRTGEERAVSPVVGVALLIAMTVILAAVIAVVVLGIGVGPAEAPQASLSFEEDGDSVYMTHEGGDSLDGGELNVSTTGSADGIDLDGEHISSGDRVEVAENVDDGDEIRIIWEDPGSDSTTVIDSFTV